LVMRKETVCYCAYWTHVILLWVLFLYAWPGKWQEAEKVYTGIYRKTKRLNFLIELIRNPSLSLLLRAYTRSARLILVNNKICHIVTYALHAKSRVSPTDLSTPTWYSCSLVANKFR
jgi:hypothetical protein